MSLNRNVYIGPYSRCETSYSRCATGRENKPNWDEVSQLIKERLHVYVHSLDDRYADQHIWMPNVGYVGNRTIGVVHDEQTCQQITAEMLAAEMAVYTEAFKAEIAVLAEMYTETSIQWGLVAWVS